MSECGTFPLVNLPLCHFYWIPDRCWFRELVWYPCRHIQLEYWQTDDVMLEQGAVQKVVPLTGRLIPSLRAALNHPDRVVLRAALKAIRYSAFQAHFCTFGLTQSLHQIAFSIFIHQAMNNKKEQVNRNWNVQYAKPWAFLTDFPNISKLW